MAGRGRPKKEDALVRDLSSIPKIASTISKDYIIPNISNLNDYGKRKETRLSGVNFSWGLDVLPGSPPAIVPTPNITGYDQNGDGSALFFNSVVDFENNVYIEGNLHLYSDFLPGTSATYDLGSQFVLWEDLWLNNDAYIGGQITTPEVISSTPHAYDFFVALPSGVFDSGAEQIAIAETLGDITITRVKVQLDISTQQLDADLKYASDFINLTSPTTINSMDTTSGVLDDTTITSASVASGKVIYMDINTIPHEDIKGMWVHIEWDYD